MIATLKRYLRAFVLALRFTLRGEQPPLLQVRDRQPALVAWWESTLQRVSEIERAAAAQGVDGEKVIVHADKRDVSMKTILAAVKYHAEREYPYLIVQNDQFSPMTLQALNLNDRYLIMKLVNVVDENLKPSVEALYAHLGELAPSEAQEV